MASTPQRLLLRLFPLTLLSFLSLFHTVAGYIQQHIVDDTNPSIQYSLSGWSKGNSCIICSEGLDLDKIHSKTWTNGSTVDIPDDSAVFFTFSFTGIYLDIVFIAQAIQPISNSTAGVISSTNATITIDGENVSYSNQLVKGSDKNSLVGYAKSLYAQGWTTNGKHDVRVELDQGSILSLDYIAYSVEMEDEVSTTSTSTISLTLPTGTNSIGSIPTQDAETAESNNSEHGKLIAIGVATGVAALIALVGFFAWLHLRRKRGTQNHVHPHPTVYDINNIPPGLPTSRFKEKMPFPSDGSTVSSPTTSTLPPSITRPRVTTLSSSVSQPLSFPVVASQDEPRAGNDGPVQVPHSAALGLTLESQDTPTAVSPSTNPFLSPRSALGDMDVPPPAYSPAPPRNP